MHPYPKREGCVWSCMAREENPTCEGTGYFLFLMMIIRPPLSRVQSVFPPDLFSNSSCFNFAGWLDNKGCAPIPRTYRLWLCLQLRDSGPNHCPSNWGNARVFFFFLQLTTHIIISATSCRREDLMLASQTHFACVCVCHIILTLLVSFSLQI